MNEICDLYEETYIRYWRGIEQFKKKINPPSPRNIKTEVHYYYGPPGVGKSRRANEEANAEGLPVFYKARGKWWDGYKQQPNVLIDDFYRWLPYDELPQQQIVHI